MALRQGRSSHTRRERNRELYARVIGVAVVIAGLVLLIMSRVDPSRGGALRTATMETTAPVWAFLRQPAAWASGVMAGIDDYFGAVSRNERLEAELNRAAMVRQERDALAQQNVQLRRLLRVVDPRRGWSRVVPIAGATAGSFVRSAVIGGGSGDGIAVGQPVRAPEGLVGQIVEVGGSAARVLLLTDTSSRVPVIVQRSGRQAMVAGVNGALLEVRYGAPSDDPLRPGDRLVTSGDGGIFPPGIPVAVVVDARSDPPTARPIARPDGLGYVVVERPYLPPVATIAATPATP